MASIITLGMLKNPILTKREAGESTSDAVKRHMRELMASVPAGDKLMTTWTPDSEVSKINAAAGDGKGVAVSAETFTVISRAVEISKKSKGLFDITVGAFKGLWKFDQDMDGTLPTPEEVAERLKLVGYKDIVLDKKKKTVRLKRKYMVLRFWQTARRFWTDPRSTVAWMLTRAVFAVVLVNLAAAHAMDFMQPAAEEIAA